MSVSRGRTVLATPGPTILPDEVLSAMHRQPIDLYGSAMEDITQGCLADLRALFGTKDSVYIYPANGHGCWEAALTNILSRGDKALALESGLFATAWADLPGRSASMSRRSPAIRAGRSIRRRWKSGCGRIATTASRRSSSSRSTPLRALSTIFRRSARRSMQPGIRALFLVDAIASLATMPFTMDDWRVDVALGAAQKGLMLPPGLAFVAAGRRAQEARQSADLVTRYWDWVFRDGEENYMKHCGTAPEHLIFGLRQSLDLLAEEGQDATFRRHQLLADAVREAVSVWSQSGALEFNIIEPAQRSNAVTTVLTRGFDPLDLQNWCDNVCGVSLGTGIGSFSGNAFRIAHMGHINAPSILGVLGSVEAGLTALRLGKIAGGVSAASALLGREAVGSRQ